MLDPELTERATYYAQVSDIFLELERPLGHGTDGCVWASSRLTAVKALYRRRNYELELACYERFRERGIVQLAGFSVPQLVAFSDELMMIEMELVTPPYILDFAKVSIDQRPDFSPEVLAEWNEQMADLFEQRLPKVRSFCVPWSTLESFTSMPSLRILCSRSELHVRHGFRRCLQLLD
jgi:hypothetical protein